MKTELSPDNRLVLDRLLSKLAGSFDGALDFWTVVCVGSFTGDRRGFLMEKAELLHALLLVSRSFLAEMHLAGQEPVHQILNTVASSCHRLRDGYLTLERFRSISLEELQAATATVVTAWQEARFALQRLSATIGVPISYWQERSPESELYFQRIADNLFVEFRQERESPQYLEPAAAVKS